MKRKMISMILGAVMFTSALLTQINPAEIRNSVLAAEMETPSMENQEAAEEETLSLDEEEETDYLEETMDESEMEAIEEAASDFSSEEAAESMIVPEKEAAVEFKEWIEDTEGEGIVLPEEVSEMQEGAAEVSKELSGRMIALASIEPGTASLAAVKAVPSYRIENGGIAEVDEVSKYEAYHELIYYDDMGNERRSPLYCMQADFHGMSSQDLRDEAIKTLNQSLVKKLLYFGYGGPGDICDSFDPTCGHIRWSRWENRYIFTHMALSKVYSGQYGMSSEEEYEHAGVNRFLAKIQSMTIPSRDGMVFAANDGSGTVVTSKNLQVNLRYMLSDLENWRWIDRSAEGFSETVQITYNIAVKDTAKAGNTIWIKREKDSPWQLGYWKSRAEMEERGEANPHVLGIGESVEIGDGAYLRMVFPKNFSGDHTFSFQMGLAPVSFLVVDGTVQTGTEQVQDFGVAVYQGTRGEASLRVHPYGYGSVLLKKTDSRNGFPVQGAKYQLYAAEDIYQYLSKTHAKNTLVGEAVTGEDGQAEFPFVLPGSYYVKEAEASTGYLLDEVRHAIKVHGGVNTLEVTEVPDMQAEIEIEKTDEKTGEYLEGAEFTVYSWDELRGKYASGIPMTYDKERQRYISGPLVYHPENQGRFLVKETKNPDGYTGSFSEEISIEDLKPGERKRFSFHAENSPLQHPHIEIIKMDQDTRELLSGAEFTLYEWNNEDKAYTGRREILEYDTETERYISTDLLETKENEGKFLVKETRNPKGYQGDWEQEIDLKDEEAIYQYTVTNMCIREIYGMLKIRKICESSRMLLKDAEFQIFAWNAEKEAYEEQEYCKMEFQETSGCYESGKLVADRQNQGRYKVVETGNPRGYEGSWEQEFAISAEDQELFFEVENTPAMGKITIIKKIKEADIIWAHGRPVFTFVAEGTDEAGIFHRYEDSVEYYPGNYETDGEGYALSEVILSNIPLGSYRIYEKPVMRYYLRAMYGNTGNVSVIQNGSPGYGKKPEDVAVAEAVLNMEEREASVTFVNEKSRFDAFSHTSYVKNTVPVLFNENGTENEP